MGSGCGCESSGNTFAGMTMSDAKLWSETRTGKDGLPYSIRYLATDVEIAGWQAAGLVGDVSHVIEMQDVADQVVAMVERGWHRLAGGALQ